MLDLEVFCAGFEARLVYCLEENHWNLILREFG